nr:MAG TPA: hypothetical protein [Caudoviricetes sp.]
MVKNDRQGNMKKRGCPPVSRRAFVGTFGSWRKGSHGLMHEKACREL